MSGRTPLSERTMGQMATKIPYGGQRSGKHAYGETHHGLAGISRMETLKEANKGKKAKSRVVLRGQKDEYRKSYTKVGARMHKKGLLNG